MFQTTNQYIYRCNRMVQAPMIMKQLGLRRICPAKSYGETGQKVQRKQEKRNRNVGIVPFRASFMVTQRQNRGKLIQVQIQWASRSGIANQPSNKLGWTKRDLPPASSARQKKGQRRCTSSASFVSWGLRNCQFMTEGWSVVKLCKLMYHQSCKC